jgi:hypothetical protein
MLNWNWKVSEVTQLLFILVLLMKIVRLYRDFVPNNSYLYIILMNSAHKFLVSVCYQ